MVILPLSNFITHLSRLFFLLLFDTCNYFVRTEASRRAAFLPNFNLKTWENVNDVSLSERAMWFSTQYLTHPCGWQTGYNLTSHQEPQLHL